MFGLKRRKPTPQRPLPDLAPPTLATFIDAIVRDHEATVARWQRVTPIEELIKYAHGTAQRAANINAGFLSGVPLRLYKPASRNDRSRVGRAMKAHLRNPARVGAKAAMLAERAGDVVEVTDHPSLALLQRPSPMATGQQQTRAAWASKQLYGNAIDFVIPGEDGTPAALMLLLTPFVRVQPSDVDGIAGYYFGRDQHDPVFIARDDALHRRWSLSLSNPYWGEGPLENVAREMDLEDQAMAAERTRWKHGGSPGGHLALKNGASPDDVKKVQDYIRRYYAGTGNQGNIFVTTEGQFTRFADAANRMGYVEGMEVLERRIFSAFGLPESMARMNDSNLASSVTGDRQYLRQTAEPALQCDAEEWTELLLPRYGVEPGDMWFAYDDVTPEDTDGKRATIQAMVPIGVMTLNEARAEMDFDPIEGGDVPRVNGVPLDEVGQQPGGMGGGLGPFLTFGGSGVGGGSEGETDAGNGGAVSVDRRADGGGGDVARADDRAASGPGSGVLARRLRAAWASDGYGSSVGCCGAVATKDDDDDLISTMLGRGRRSRVVAALQRDVQAWLLDQAASSSRLVDGGDIDEQALADLIEPRIEQLFRIGAEVAIGEIEAGTGEAPDSVFEVSPTEAIEYARRQGSLIIEEVTGTTRDGIRQVVTAGLEEGLSQTEIARGLEQAMTDASPYRAEMIARTETSNAIHAARTAQFRSAGIARQRWINAPNPSAAHAQIAQRYPDGLEIGRPFVKAGETIAGETFKRDVYHPPARPNCRCGIEPVFDVEGER